VNGAACADKAKISHALEKVAQLGCSKVSETIKQIEQGKTKHYSFRFISFNGFSFV